MRRAALSLAAVLLTGCVAPIAPPAGPSVSSGAIGSTSGSPSVSASPTPSSAAVTTVLPTSAGAVPVAKVVDGDTIHVTMPDGTDQVVRFIGVNTPETTKGKHDCYGAQATAYVTELVSGRSVTLTTDPTQADRDRYGRLLRYITLDDGSDLELLEIQQGYGKEATYAGAYEHQALYRQAQREAQAEQKGGWAPAAAGGCGW